MRIGQRLRKAMQSANLSQKKLAERAGMPEATVSAVMKGTRGNPKWDTVERLVNAIPTTWGDLFDEPRIQLTTKDAALTHEFHDFLGRLLANDKKQKELRQAQSAGTLGDKPDRVRMDEVREERKHPIPEEFDRDGAKPFRVLTDAMIGVGILEDSVIFCQLVPRTQHLDPYDGDIAVVSLDERLYLRRIDRRGNQTVLTSENTQRYGDIHVKPSEKCEIVAVFIK